MVILLHRIRTYNNRIYNKNYKIVQIQYYIIIFYNLLLLNIVHSTKLKINWL